MANPFDQFDAATKPASAGNPFDQFDTEANPFDRFDDAGNVMGIVNAARRAGRSSLAGLDVMGALNQQGRAQGYEDLAKRYESEADRADQAAVPPGFERYLGEQARHVAQFVQADGVTLPHEALAFENGTPGKTLRKYAAALRSALPANEARQLQSFADSAANTKKAEAIPLSEDYRAYGEAHGWEAVKQFLKNPVEIPLTIAAEGMAGSVPALVAGAAGGMVAGVPGLAAGAGLGSYTTEYASTILDTLREHGVDAEDPAALRQAFSDTTVMAEAKKRAVARGIPVAAFDALSGGLAGRTVAPAVKGGIKALAKATAKEVGEQAALGMAGETAGQISEQLATKGTVDDLNLKDIVAEGIGEIVPGFGQVATGALARTRLNPLRKPANDKPATPPAPNPSPAATTGAPASATPSETPNAQPSTLNSATDLASEIGASLPDAESRDVLAGRSTEAEARKLAVATVDFGATVQSVQDALLTAGATPAQLDALDFQLRTLEERKDKRRLKPEQVNASLANTFLFQTLPPAEVFPLVSRLAADSANIAQLRAGLTALRTGPAPAPAAAAPALNPQPSTLNPAASPLTPEQRAAKLAVLQEAAQAAAAEKSRAEQEREQARVTAAAEAKAQTERVRAENARLAQLEKTGRDEAGKIVDLSRLPAAELDALDLEREGITEAQYSAEQERRARAEERQAAASTNRGEELLDVLAQVKLPGESATLPEELKTLIREGMTPKQRMALVRAGVGELDRTAEALRGRGFTWAQTPADVIDHVQRALRGEKIYAEGTPDDVQFSRRAKVDVASQLAETAPSENEETRTPEAQDVGDVSRAAGADRRNEPDTPAEAPQESQPQRTGRRLKEIEAKLTRGAAERDTAARAFDSWVDDTQGKTRHWFRQKWDQKTGQPYTAAISREEAQALSRAIDAFDQGEKFVWPSEALRRRVSAQFSRRPTAPNPVATAPLAARWLDNLSLIAPGVAREIQLRFGSPEQLVESGRVAASDLTGEEEAATVRQARGAMQSIVYLFDRALRANTDQVTRLNLLHEIGHLFYDTLDTATRRTLREQWDHERTTSTGPLFDAEGNLRENVALGVFDESNPEHALHEWFAERLAHANDGWAQRRTEVRARGDGLLRTLAHEFRAMLLKLRELLERAFGRNAYDDTLVSDFRKFLDQGERWNEASPEAAAGLAGSFAKTGLPAFANRAQDRALQLTPEQAAHELPIVALPAKPLGPEGTLKAAKKRALDSLAEWYGKPVVNGNDGTPILITRNGVQHGMQNEGPANVQMVPALPELLRTALKLATEEHSPAEPTVKTVHRYAAALRLGDQLYRVKLTVKELTNGTNLYDHAATQIESPDGNDLPRRSSSEPLADEPTSGDTVTLAQLFGGVKSGERVQFARRTPANPEGHEGDQLLRDYASLERTRDRYVSEGGRVPRHVLTGLADLREALEETLPGWREQAKAATQTPDPQPQTSAASETTEPEAGASALFPADEGTVAPEATATKRSQLEASTLRRPTGVRDWLASLGRLFTNFRSAIPELPGGAQGRTFTAFRQGYRMIKAATEFTRKNAEEQVAHIVAPLTGLGREAIAPEVYRELQRLQQIRQEHIDAAKPIRPELTARIAALDAQLDAVPYHLFRKVALYRDLFFRSRLESPNGEPLRLPFGLTAAEIETTLRELHAKVKASPAAQQIEESLRRHYALVKDVRDGLLARGYIIPEELRNPLYFPHIVLDKASGALTRVKLDTAEDFRGYLVRLVGSDRAIESDYLQAMYYHLATVEAHNARQDIVEKYWQPYDIKARLEKEAADLTKERKARGLGAINWRQLVPAGHTIYTVDDRIPLRPEYMINRSVLAEKLGVQLGEGDLQKQLRDLGMSITLTAEDFEQALMHGEKTQWVIPAPVAAALRAVLDRESRTAGLAEKVLTTPQGLWKRWTLFAPQNVIRYTYGNMVADLEKLFSADPGVFRQLRPALAEVRAFYDGEQPSADLRAAFQRGVLDAVTVGEVTDLARQQLDQFAAFTTSRERFVGMLQRGLGWGVTVNRIREAAFRYAKFKADMARQRAGAEPVYAGAYNRDVRAIQEETPEATHYARAAEISRKTFGDYADISVSGDGLRKYFIPFYSWMEVNFRYHANLFRNLGDMGAGAGAAQVARGAASAASRILVARSATGVLLRLAVPYAAVALWNNSGDREELEKTLSDEDRRRFHIILGKDAQGRTLVAYAPTALSDVMKWFGGNEFARLAGEYIRGQITFPQLAHEWISNTPGDVLNNALQGISPQIKAAMIATTRKQPFPDILNQRSIADHDLWWAVLGSTTDGLTADALRRLVDGNYYSGKSWGDWAQQNILQARRRDPEQWGYYATMDRVDAYKKAHGGTSEIGVNNKADAEMLGSFRRAIRAGDVPAALTFYQKLLDAGYTAERFRASIDHADPLATLKRTVRKEFVAGLSPSEQEDLRNGYKYAARMQAFDRRERQLFPSEKAVPAYRQNYAAQGGRPDVFAGIMEDFGRQPEAQLDLRAEHLMRGALRPVKR